MPKAQKGSGVDKYPGLKEFATRVYDETPATQHDSLRLQLNYFVNQAKLTGDATKMNWTSQTLQTLAARFGTPGTSPFIPPATSSHGSNGTAFSKAAAPHTNNSRIQNEGSIQPKVRRISTETGLRPGVQAAGRRPAKAKEASPLRASKFGTGLKTGAATQTSARSPSCDENKSSSVEPESQEVLRADTVSLSTTRKADELTNKPVGGALRGSQREAPKGSRQARGGVAERRRARFESPAATESPYMELHTGGPIVGTSQKLEKSYFRLTGQVNASVVRPPHVVARALDYVYAKYEQDRSNYSYISDQLKSLRQDLTVQHVTSSLTVRVYECNARVALEHDDLGEYNQCSAQLHALYAQARELRDKHEATQMLLNEKEFQAYVIYYKIYVGAWEELGVLLRELDTDATADATTADATTADATADAAADAAANRAGSGTSAGPAFAPSHMLARALQCVTMVTRRQLAALFACWRESTLLERRLIGKFAVREQLRTLEAMARATTQQNQTLPLAFLARGLGLAAADVQGFLDTWSVPHDGTAMRSVEALPAISQAVRAVSGPADIKGQI